MCRDTLTKLITYGECNDFQNFIIIMGFLCTKTTIFISTIGLQVTFTFSKDKCDHSSCHKKTKKGLIKDFNK